MVFIMNEEIGLAAHSAKSEAKTGEKCPQGGIWYPKDCIENTRAIGIKDVMPPSPTGCSQVWVLKVATGDM